MIKRKMVLGGVLILLMAILVWSDPGFSKLNIQIRDSSHPCKPYSSSGHTFGVAVFNCDLSILTAKWLPFTPGGTKIHGKIMVPEGSYIVVGFATCKNVWTNWVYVNACCGKEVCVNLIPRRFEQCLNEMKSAINAAIWSIVHVGGYSFSSPEKQVDKKMKKALEKAAIALDELSRYLPKFEIDIPFDVLKKSESAEQLMKLFEKKQKK